MAGKPLVGDEISTNFAGMSKNQLHDIMIQMKQLIEQNQQQARQILVQNPLLTRALFQAQIMLDMLQPPQVVSSDQPTTPQNPLQPKKLAPPPVVQASPTMQTPINYADQPSAQTQFPQRQVKNQPVPTPYDTAPIIAIPSPSMSSQPSHIAQQQKAHMNSQTPHMSLSHTPQVANVPPNSFHSTPQPTTHQSQLSSGSNPMHQPFSTSTMVHPSMQPPLPPQPRPPSIPNFHHQSSQQLGPSFHHSSIPQMHHSQNIFHSGKQPSNVAPPFPLAQASPLPAQQPPQALYQVDRGSPWIPGLTESTSAQLPGPPPLPPNPMAPGNQPPRPPPMTPEMEKALLQQVMSLTPEQINLLPPDQRQQVHQLQQMLRQ